uniref:Temptin Cys/Cys disulfide domain-containing protein n=1 Tax=Aplanochytrium stocchinoi TaxID=215587 RepID=A0A7S3V217_9STRA|mmetsp:Transcript_5359/g.6763  ORF Transcript_5359/g.6763 Transcript_5359/m.6763 type:complete len:172 (+) Transcript_5359:264-779(+)|eukprot:CAMPEP_0204828220 /NCGR_PEP_ID=MMETSP1346-20131115/5887_1 /ASSEMBLY_ACC=CAM_ASM_000771 /TAXON_ID=215587 /ORGANISM="Aplanochytrium stocchinoi, Strain GSBS06" /LENGTH=171 /DNA_ID=CAMNT_0051957121 /DNA_START=258 /DNA_END=773 /DNA_ORIENTATION=-
MCVILYPGTNAVTSVWVLLIPLAVTFVSAYPDYTYYIPNARKVESSSRPGKYVEAIGHTSEYGTGQLNDFGEDFVRIGKMKWSKSFCEHDSDGDGLSNGYELGDPECLWEYGMDDPIIPSVFKISHPGIHKNNEKRLREHIGKVENGIPVPVPVPSPQAYNQDSPDRKQEL